MSCILFAVVAPGVFVSKGDTKKHSRKHSIIENIDYGKK